MSSSAERGRRMSAPKLPCAKCSERRTKRLPRSSSGFIEVVRGVGRTRGARAGRACRSLAGGRTFRGRLQTGGTLPRTPRFRKGMLPRGSFERRLLVALVLFSLVPSLLLVAGGTFLLSQT